MGLFRKDLNDQVFKIEVSDIRQFDDEVSQIPGMIKLTMGEPDFNTPDHIKKAAIEAINENYSHYMGMAGDIELRTAASEFFNEKYGVSYDAQSEILVTVGATEAIATALQTIFNPGDAVLVPTPLYPGYMPLITLNRIKPIYIDTRDNNFRLTPDMINQAIADNPDETIKGIILINPSNPTGISWTEDEIIAITDEIRTQKLWAISDEIYSELTYGHNHISIAKYIRDQTVLINGLSKSHAMTGWRIGFLLAPKAMTDELKKVHQYLVTSATSVSQRAGIAALRDGKDDGRIMNVEYKKRRDFVMTEMKKMHFEMAEPSGAFYIFAKIPEGYNQDAMAFCKDLAFNHKLALIPGTAFGESGKGYIRLSYAASMDNLVAGMERLNAYMTENK
ncbi:pyridoxal phosphate-dependent aminotransferase [Dellaglioa algida]|nr:pyridoxal phosphate-dependent aminotransferase [Dellaglioa algida]MDK1718779.1 pyridoxal phosphate-dependent aminotransferase [Dellaglioa algida]MDK1728214.1 pyridoxal phosphate-dependent aminotransferase [Dellaglioa algida]MDK1730071.1 pyridoxal phosphate-dependent aminotransferase [Dellaglioa algida]MDK1732103.1 pyridoxal phosphate-dependent aminotransferase [Dellaglioa algida]MDK1733629.1 pyridoxal phosphate-dependent aminotransferase [Dellaglioa algida]